MSHTRWKKGNVLRIVQKILKLWRGSGSQESSNLYECLCFVSQSLQMDRYDFVILVFTILLIAAVQFVNPAQEGTAFIYFGLIILELGLFGLKKYIWPG